MPLSSNEPAAPYDPSGARLLIVDDTPANLGVLAEQLESLGYSVLVAQDGEEGLERARLTHPELILLDVMMPGIDGYETCRRLKRDEATRQIPVIFMSALDALHDKLRGLEAGGVDYISKPFQIEEVEARVKVHLHLRQLQAQLSDKVLALEQSEGRYRLLVEMSPDAILVERDDRIRFANSAAVRLFGAERPEALLERSMLSLTAPESRMDAIVNLQALDQQSSPQSHEEQALRLDGDRRDVMVSRVRIEYDGRPAVQMVLRDITERKRLESRLHFQATHDSLTRLPNRELFRDRLQQAISQAKRNSEQVTVSFIDLDHFKSINDSLGHEVGDELLVEVSRRIRTCLRESDTLARLGGDEFVLLLPQSNGIPSGDTVLERVLETIALPMQLSGNEIGISASVGCAHYPDDGEDCSTLLKHADVAMYHAKESGRNSIRHYDRLVREESEERLLIEQELKLAISRNQLSLHYQVQTDLGQGAINGVEALLRWQHPQLGAVSPVRFIPIAERSGLIAALTAWVLEQVCIQIKRWQQQGLTTVPVAVNISGHLLRDPDWLEQEIERCLQQSAIDPGYLELEITESASMGNAQTLIPLLTRLKQRGLKLAIDDFGTGYSNMNYLTQFPVDKLKIDGSFIREITSEPKSLALTETIIAMAHRLDMKVVAEMTETPGQLRMLSSKGCDEVQGFVLARPLPADACAELLRQGRMALPHKESEDKARVMLILDDDPMVLSAIRRELRRDGYTLLPAETEPQALELLACHEVGVVLSDLRLKGSNGIEFLSKVKTLYPNAVRMVISAHQDFESARAAINYGAVHKFLSKPWAGDELRQVTADAFELHELVTEHALASLPPPNRRRGSS